MTWTRIRSKLGRVAVLARWPLGTPLRLRLTAVIGAVALLGAGVASILAITASPPSITLTAQFTSAPGLYVGNQVDVLGMPVGKVLKVTPGPASVTVVMVVPRSVRLPLHLRALIEAPNVVSDRYVQLTPPYTSGPVLGADSLIPLADTAVPISNDQITDSLDRLATALGPSGANAHGALGQLFASLARTLGGNGPALHSTISSLGGAFGALSSSGPNLTALLDGLGQLTQVASQYTANYQAFASSLASVSSALAADDPILGQALASLQQLLGKLASFINSNSSALSSSVSNFSVFAAAIGSQQHAVSQVLSTLPLALQNVTKAYSSSGPGGPGLSARLDLMSGSSSFANSVCGDALLRLSVLAFAANQDPTPTSDLACGVNGLLQSLPTPPGSSAGPDLSLAAFVPVGK